MANEMKIKPYPTRKNSDVILIPRGLRKTFFSPSNNNHILKAPISSWRIISKVLNDISFDQFRPEKEGSGFGRLAQFEEEFKTSNNTYASFCFSINEISQGDDYSNIKKGLVFLENLYKGLNKTINELNGETVKQYSVFIKDPVIKKGKISFLISAYLNR